MTNDLIGNVPSEIVRLTQLTGLYLYQNRLTGYIPTEVVGNQQYLTGLSLRINDLTGSVPSEIGRLTQLNDLSL